MHIYENYIKSIAHGRLGNHGLLVLRHAEVGPVRRLEQNLKLKIMGANALELLHAVIPATNKIVRVNIIVLYQNMKS